MSSISERHRYNVNLWYVDESFIDFFCSSFLLWKIESVVFKCLRAMPAMHTSEEIRADGSSSHSLPLCSVPLPLQSSFFSNCISLFSASTYVAFSSFLPPLCLSPPLFLSPPFCGWQSPWDYAHSKLENLKLCPNTSLQDLPREIPHGCLHAADIPVCLPFTSLRQLRSHMSLLNAPSTRRFFV